MRDFKASFLSLMAKEQFQLPKRIKHTYQESLISLLDTYLDELTFVTKNQKVEIEEICMYLKKLVSGQVADQFLFEELMTKTTLFMHLDILSEGPLVDGFGRSNANLFRVRLMEEERELEREALFHAPVCDHVGSGTYRYSIETYPSLYLGSTLHCCYKELGINEHRKTVASMYRFNPMQLGKVYIINLGTRPIDFVKRGKGKANKERIRYCYIDYLYVYPLLAACSFIAVNKQAHYHPEYLISNLFIRYLNRIRKDKVLGIRYFSCALHTYFMPINGILQKESDSSYSFTKYYINYVFPCEIDTYQMYSPILKKTFLVSKPKHAYDCLDLKDFETTIKKQYDTLHFIK